MDSRSQAATPFGIAILLYNDVEELDFVGPFEVFQIAAVLAARERASQESAWHVFTIAEQAGIVTTSGGLQIQPHFTMENHPPIDVLLIPGGDASKVGENAVVLDWLKAVTAQARFNTSVCTGAFVLGALGLLDGHNATTHRGSLDSLAERFPKTRVQCDVRWVDEGSLITSAGISAGIDMSLHLVERLLGREAAEKIARYMEYTWDDHGHQVI